MELKARGTVRLLGRPDPPHPHPTCLSEIFHTLIALSCFSTGSSSRYKSKVGTENVKGLNFFKKILGNIGGKA